MPTTPVYGLRYQALTDPPNGSSLSEMLAEDVEEELVRVDAAAALNLTVAAIARAEVLITPVANTPTSGNVTWGKTLPGTVVAVAIAETTQAGAAVREVSLSAITSTGATAWIYRDNTTATTVHVIAVGLV
jgi:hypothetical protein